MGLYSSKKSEASLHVESQRNAQLAKISIINDLSSWEENAVHSRFGEKIY